MAEPVSTVAFSPRAMSEAPVPGVSPALKTTRIDEIEDIAFVLDCVGKSQDFKQPFEPIWDEIRDNYMVVPYGGTGGGGLEGILGLSRVGVANRSLDNRSRLKDPETHQIIETLTSQALALLLPASGFLRAIPYYDPEKARFIERLLMAYMSAPGEYRTHYQLVKNAFTYGTAYAEIGWQTLTRMQAVRRPAVDEQSGLVVYDENGAPMNEMNWEEVIYRDEPLVTEIPIRQAYPDPGGTRIQKDMLWFAKGFRLSKQGAIRLRDATTWNHPDAVRRALEKIGDSRETPSDIREQVFPGMRMERPDKYGMNPGFEWWGETPYNRPGGRNRVITIWASERVRSHPNPYIDGNIPIKEFVVNPIGGRHYGLSPAEVVRFLQDATDSMLMLFTDAGELAVRGPVLLGQAFGGDPERVKASLLNDVIKCRNVDAVKPIPRDYGALDFGAQEIARRILRIREAAGATNPLQAIPGPVEKTATETSELVRLATQRVQTMVELIERDDYPWFGRTIHSRFRQFGAEAMMAIIQNEAYELTLDDIDVDADIRFVGSTQAQTPDYEHAIATISAAPPEFVEQYPELFTRYFRDKLKIQDADKWVKRAVEIAQMRQIVQQATAGAQAVQRPARPGTPKDQQGAAESVEGGEALNAE